MRVFCWSGGLGVVYRRQDSSAAPDIKWTVPAGVFVSAFKYPYPERIPYGPLMNYGYHNEVLMPFSVSVPADYPADAVDIKGTGRVLVCADICIPEKVEVMVSIPIGPVVYTHLTMPHTPMH